MSLYSLRPDVRHQLAFQLSEEAQYIAGLFVKEPRHAVALVAVQTAVGGEHTESRPSLVDVGSSGSFKSSHIVRGVAEAGDAEREAASYNFCHRVVVARAVAAPVYGELLTACGSRTCEQASLVFAVVLFKHVEYALVVEVGVEVVHLYGVAAVEILDAAGRYSFAKVGLESIYAHFAERAELGSVPLAGCGVGKVNYRHAGLPLVALENIAVFFHDEVAACYALVKEL